MSESNIITVPTRHGPARLHETTSPSSTALFVITHGAGGGVDAPDLLWFVEHGHEFGCDVVRVEMPWRVAGRKIAPRPATLDECWLDAFADQSWHPSRRKLIVGGRSAGARVALRTAEVVQASGVLALAFPLHPPGKPASSRASELIVDLPLVIVQGERDPFGRPEEFPAGVDLLTQPGTGHDLVPEATLGEGLRLLLARI